MLHEFDYLFKIVIIGNSAVGKSSLLRRFADDSFQQSYLATIGVDFRFKTLKVKQSSVKLQIWDTAGQQRFRTITSAYYKGAHGIIVVYDILNQKSFQDIQDFWFGQIQKYAQPSVQLTILGNKADIQQRIVSRQSAVNYGIRKNVPVFDVSAKTGDTVNDAILKMVQKLMQKHPKIKNQGTNFKQSVMDNIKKRKSQIKLQGGTQKTKKSCQC